MCAAIKFEQQQLHQQLNAEDHNYFYGRSAISEPLAVEENSSRTHHGKHKLKKLKKRLLLQCLLGHGQRRRRDTTAASARFLLPVVLQSTNVNIGSSGSGGSGTYSDPLYQYGDSSGCMQMLNDHGPSLGSLGSGLGSLLGSPMEDVITGGGSRNGLYADWNRYARQFHRNYIRPVYRLF